MGLVSKCRKSSVRRKKAVEFNHFLTWNLRHGPFRASSPPLLSDLIDVVTEDVLGLFLGLGRSGSKAIDFEREQTTETATVRVNIFYEVLTCFFRRILL